MLTQLSREDCLTQYPNLPQINYRTNESFFPTSVAEYILQLNSKSAKGHSKNLSQEFSKLMTNLHIDSLVFMGDAPITWRYQQNDYKPVQEALQYLIDKGVKMRFNGALKLDKDDLTVFIRHLFWLTRCNASLPDFFFIDPEQNFVGSICKYGNLHMHLLSGNIDLKNAVAKGLFVFSKDGDCYSTFSKTSVIENRQIIL